MVEKKKLLPWVVLKFGGTSVLDLSCWQRITKVVRARLNEGLRPFLVFSAPRGVSDALAELTHPTQAPTSDTLNYIQTVYQDLAASLGVVFDDQLKAFINDIRLTKAMLDKQPHARHQAQLMFFGEWILTHLAHRFFDACGLRANFIDARNVLRSKKQVQYQLQHYMNAHCDCEFDLAFSNTISDFNMVLTQGFIASNHLGETVVLGRGGSDTSAAYFGRKLGASGVEIWTDVAGVYTANPKIIPEARLLPTLDYEEAQEIALMGGKVLHPRALSPLALAKIPMHVRSSYDLTLHGTVIAPHTEYRDTQIKSIISKKGVMLIQMTGLAMWRQAGFLAEVFHAFKQHGVSVDLISTSEMNVTVTLDVTRNELRPSVIDALLADLNQFCSARLLGPCGSISLIGRRMRSMLYKLSGCLSLLSEQKVYLISQASNDLNFSFVVEEKVVDRLVQKLHHILLEDSSATEHVNAVSHHVKQTVFYAKDDWWVDCHDILLDSLNDRLPAYVYHGPTLRQKANNVLSVSAIDQSFYAVKANANKHILRLFEQMGLGFECVSIHEVQYLFELMPEIDPQRIIFTPNFIGQAEYQQAIDLGVWIILDSLYPLAHWPELFQGQSVLLRVDPGVGHGHHRYVTTGGQEAKFGIPREDLLAFLPILQSMDVTVIGLHVHTGSGVLDVHHWQDNAAYLLQLLPYFPDVTIVNLGGGLGVAQKPGEPQLNLSVINEGLLPLKQANPNLIFWWEPGRYLVAESGILLSRVTQVKQKAQRFFVGMDTGMNSLIRPALYGAYHHIINLSRLHEPCVMRANLVGPICESSDCFGYERLIPETKAGDVMLVSHVGAYGYSMSSHYNLRQPAVEYFFDGQMVLGLND